MLKLSAPMSGVGGTFRLASVLRQPQCVSLVEPDSGAEEKTGGSRVGEGALSIVIFSAVNEKPLPGDSVVC